MGRTYEERRQWDEFIPWPAGLRFQDAPEACEPEPVHRGGLPAFGISIMGCAAAMVVASR